MMLPAGGEIGRALALQAASASLDDLMETALLAPLREFLSRPAKGFRGQFVELGLRLASGRTGELSEREAGWCAAGASLLESLHAGSLVVDDIQDDSLMRRGRATLHREHGVPLALNAGNWLYFWPLENVRSWGLPATMELDVYRVCHRALLRAHFGQALDVGVPVDELPQGRIREVCLASLELKTGALMALAVSLGAVLGGADETRRAALDEFGHAFGIALQMFDDLGNLKVKRAAEGAADGKQYEDLKLRRPSWVWAVAASQLDAREFAAFVSAVRELPRTEALETFLARAGLATAARADAKRYLTAAIERLSAAVGTGAAVDVVAQLGERLTKAYE